MQLDKDKNDNVARLTFTKMKDGDVPAPLAFRFRSISLNIFDEDGEELCSSIVEPTEYIAPVKSGTACTGKNQTKAKEVLFELMKSKPEDQKWISRDEWKTTCIARGINGNRFNQTITPLIEHDYVRHEDGKYTIDLPFD
jgi:hypothetical protein